MNHFDKVTDYEKVASLFFDGMTLLFGGFGGVGTPPSIIDCLIETGVKDVHLIGNDAGFPWIKFKTHQQSLSPDDIYKIIPVFEFIKT